MNKLKSLLAFFIVSLQLAALIVIPMQTYGQPQVRSFDKFAQFGIKLDGWRTQKYNLKTHKYETFQPANVQWQLRVNSCNRLPKKEVEYDNPKPRPDGKPSAPTKEVSFYPARFATYEWSIKESRTVGAVTTKRQPVTTEL